jgi:hypothetical protein
MLLLGACGSSDQNAVSTARPLSVSEQGPTDTPIAPVSGTTIHGRDGFRYSVAVNGPLTRAGDGPAGAAPLGKHYVTGTVTITNLQTDRSAAGDVRPELGLSQADYQRYLPDQTCPPNHGVSPISPIPADACGISTIYRLNDAQGDLPDDYNIGAGGTITVYFAGAYLPDDVPEDVLRLYVLDWKNDSAAEVIELPLG